MDLQCSSRLVEVVDLAHQLVGVIQTAVDWVVRMVVLHWVVPPQRVEVVALR